MIFSHLMTRDYPHSTVYLRRALATLPTQQKKVWEEFMFYGEYMEDEALEVIREGSEPTLLPVHMGRHNYGSYEGQFDSSKVNWIYMNKYYFEMFDASEENRQDKMFQQFLLGVLLHELVHFGDARDGVDPGAEEGEAFERAAYGRRLFPQGVWQFRAMREWMAGNAR
ncbi:hypothetical protein [Oceanicola sp. 502str15]|uniref:hypothetical protein n=1 Tax=Oceanicola sp. 502str15 TaxID=2696061 RepID=UPI0020963F65|nr:hypothetical protein [Oceanicola sp. 502str15]MCO6382493.1 hypothetical protein [Oceanicola sp. 502str15]